MKLFLPQRGVKAQNGVHALFLNRKIMFNLVFLALSVASQKFYLSEAELSSWNQAMILASSVDDSLCSNEIKAAFDHAGAVYANSALSPAVRTNN
jgi:hypothetical protein